MDDSTLPRTLEQIAPDRGQIKRNLVALMHDAVSGKVSPAQANATLKRITAEMKRIEADLIAESELKRQAKEVAKAIKKAKEEEPKPRDGVFQRKDRKGWYISWVDAQGKRRKRKTGATTISLARKALRNELVEVEKAKALGLAPVSKDTFGAVSERYLKDRRGKVSQEELKPESYERTKGVVEKHLKPFFEGKKIASITTSDVERYLTERSTEVKKGTLVREFAILKHLLSYAVEKKIVRVSPAAELTQKQPKANRVRYLHPGEFRALLAVCPIWLQPIVILAVVTGMRRGELLAMRWLDVDLANGHIWLPQTKNEEARAVSLNQTATAVFEQLEPTSGLVFPGVTGNQVTMAFRRGCKAAEIKDFRFHDLRHTAASWMIMTGSDTRTVAEQLGHKDPRMTRRYQHLGSEFMKKAVGGLDKVFGELSPHRVSGQKLLEGKKLATH